MSFLTGTNLFPTQWTQGQLIAVTVYTLDVFGHIAIPDFTPFANLTYITPTGSQSIFVNRLMTPINNSFYFLSIDSTFLAPGSYICTTNWSVSGNLQNAQVSLVIVPFDGATFAVNDPITRLRIRLRDMAPDPTRWVWSEQDLSEFLNDSLENFNASPPLTNFFWFNIPLQYLNAILLYGEYLSLQSQANKLAAQAAISYQDRGLAVNKLSQAQFYKNLADTLFDRADGEQKRIKRQLAYGTGYITTPNLPFIANIPLRAMGRQWNL